MYTPRNTHQNLSHTLPLALTLSSHLIAINISPDNASYFYRALPQPSQPYKFYLSSLSPYFCPTPLCSSFSFTRHCWKFWQSHPCSSLTASLPHPPSVPHLLSLSPLTPYRWLNAHCDERAELFLRTAFQPLPFSSYQQCSLLFFHPLPFSFTHTRAMLLSHFDRFAKILIDLSRGLSSSRTCPTRFPFPSCHPKRGGKEVLSSLFSRFKPFRRLKSFSCAHPLGDRPCLASRRLLSSPISFLLPLPGHRDAFLSVAALRGSTTTEKRTALFVWRSIATRQLRDCNVGTVKPTLLPSTILAFLYTYTLFCLSCFRLSFPNHRLLSLSKFPRFKSEFYLE